jgi:murein DD-endopeptidase MepM/ murein hydrolase activator NlpD
VGERFKNSANYVIVRHSDGTYGEYLHLQPNAAMVRLGETVQAGQPIAHSGNSGYSSRPHLHFGVFRIREDNTRESVLVKMRIGTGVETGLEEGRNY